MKTAIVFALLLLAASPFAADYPTGMKLFGYYAVPQGTSFTVENFTHQNTSAYAIVSGGEVYALLMPHFPFIMPQPITELAQIKSALASYHLSHGNSPMAKDDIQPIHAGVQSVAGNRLSGEAECRRLAGLESMNCSGFECYRTACLAGASSFCPNFAYGGTPGEFIYVIWSFENNTHELDAAYRAENESYLLAAANSSRERMAAYIEALSRLNRAATAASGSALFLYSFCAEPDYSLPVVTNMQLSAQKRWRAAQHYYELANTSLAVQNRTLAAIAQQTKFALPELQNRTDIIAEEKNASAEKRKEYEKEKNAFMQTAVVVPLAAALALTFLSGGALIVYAFFIRKKKE